MRSRRTTALGANQTASFLSVPKRTLGVMRQMGTVIFHRRQRNCQTPTLRIDRYGSRISAPVNPEASHHVPILSQIEQTVRSGSYKMNQDCNGLRTLTISCGDFEFCLTLSRLLQDRTPCNRVNEENLMRKLKVGKIWILAFLLVVAIAGCNDPDSSKNGPPPALTPPTVISVLPAGASTGVCQDTLVTATFSKIMNPATINTGTFKLAAGATAVVGTVTLDTAGLVATFTPSSPLALNTVYTATITTGAQDQFGIGLASDFSWSFTTAAAPCQGSVGVGSACGFGILAGTPSVTNVGPTHVTGNIGIWPAASIVGFPPGTLTGTEHTGDAVAQTAQGDLTTAYNAAAGAAGGAALTGDIGGQTLLPGVYKATSTLGITGNLTLNANGDPNAAWIFQVGSALTTAAGNSQVILIGGAQAHNITWQVGSSATLGTNTTFQGTIMAQASITLTTGATLNGRALARTGAVTLDSNPVNVPPCP